MIIIYRCVLCHKEYRRGLKLKDESRIVLCLLPKKNSVRAKKERTNKRKKEKERGTNKAWRTTMINGPFHASNISKVQLFLPSSSSSISLSLLEQKEKDVLIWWQDRPTELSTKKRSATELHSSKSAASRCLSCLCRLEVARSVNSY